MSDIREYNCLINCVKLNALEWNITDCDDGRRELELKLEKNNLYSVREGRYEFKLYDVQNTSYKFIAKVDKTIGNTIFATLKGDIAVCDESIVIEPIKD